MSEDISLRITGVDPGDEIAGARKLKIRTTRGEIAMLLHESKAREHAVLCLSGAIGGFDGPSRLYPRFGLELPRAGIAVARLDWRVPNDFSECLVDAMAGLTFLRGIEFQNVTIVGHSFGAAVAINAGSLGQNVSGVIALSSQLGGAHTVGDLSPRPLLLIHGTADTILSHESSKTLFEHAKEPKTLKLIAGADHSFSAQADEIFVLARDWIASHQPPPSERKEEKHGR